MVTIGPPKYNVGTQIGQSLGQGLQQGMTQGVQRGLLQQALGKARDLSQQKGAKPIDLMLGLMEAGAGIPGSERYLSTLLPILLNAQRAEGLYGQEGSAGAMGGAGGAPVEGQQAFQTPADASEKARKFTEGETPQGYLALPMTPEQQQDYAKNYALALNDPAAFQTGLSEAQNLNATRIAARQSIANEADAVGIRPDEKQRFMQYATEVQDTNDPTKILRYARDKTLQLRNFKEALQKVDVPGAYQKLGGPAQHFVPGMTLYKALTSKGEPRRKALEGYGELVRNIVNEGEEPFARETLANKGISPGEIEELIHPLSKQTAQNIEKLPRGNQLNPKARQDSLVNFFKGNVNNDTSLTVLRNYLVEDKNYSWEEVRDAVKSAFPNAEKLTKYQSAELPNIAKPPIQSLSQIFGPTPNLPGFLRGQR